MKTPKDVETESHTDDGRYVQRGKRFDSKHDAGARVIRAGENAIAEQLKAAGASPGSADWGGAAGKTEGDEPDPASLGFKTPSKPEAATKTAGNPSGGPRNLKP